MIAENVKRLLARLPAGVELVAAVKTRSGAEVAEALDAGLAHVGHNYVQEARAMDEALAPRRAGFRNHLIGHLQTNKAREAVRLFDVVQTVDSLRLAEALEKECSRQDKTLDILVEVNSGREENKAGVMPEAAEALVRGLFGFGRLRVAGLMTMGPFLDRAEDMRPYFRLTRGLFDGINASLPAERRLTVLSMGMTDSWEVAVAEGSNMIRVGTLIFGARPKA